MFVVIESLCRAKPNTCIPSHIWIVFWCATRVSVYPLPFLLNTSQNFVGLVRFGLSDCMKTSILYTHTPEDMKWEHEGDVESVID